MHKHTHILEAIPYFVCLVTLCVLYGLQDNESAWLLLQLYSHTLPRAVHGWKTDDKCEIDKVIQIKHV